MADQRFRILHCLRAPVGGLFRHVRDLAREQAARGHEVGVVCDASSNDSLTEARLAALEPVLALGLIKVPMSREIGPADLGAIQAVRRFAEIQNVSILHGHGAKGGAYARFAARGLKRVGRRVACFYTPHGGSLHYDPASLTGRAFMMAERGLMGMTDGLIFESRYARETYALKVGAPRCATRVIHNGILAEELRPVDPAPDAADFVYVGELRTLKGVDVLIEALAAITRERACSAVIVGAGPDAQAFHQQVERLGLGGSIRFPGALPARDAFRLGRILVMPSRAESLPYVALEAAGACLPLIATRVGGVPEIVEGTTTTLVEPGDSAALAEAMLAALASPIHAADRAAQLARVIAERFSIAAMTAGIEAFYGEALVR